MSFFDALSATAARIVRALSAADIPVVTPLAASIDTVKLVARLALLTLTIKGKSNCLHRCSVNVRQIRPRPLVAIKFISCGRTIVAAITKSPSFSRFSSSIRITILP